VCGREGELEGEHCKEAHGAVTPPRSQGVDQQVSVVIRAGDSGQHQTQPSDRPVSPQL